MTIQTLQGALQQSIRNALGCANDFNGDLHAMCDLYGIPAAPISGRLIPAAQKFDASITTASSALNYFLQNPQNACGTLALDFTTTSTLDPRITFTRGSQATLFDSTGTLVRAKHNLWLQSADFSSGSWSKVRSSISADATTAPDGTTTADKFIPNTDNSTHFVRQDIAILSGITYTQSIYAKASEYTQIRMSFDTDLSGFAGGEAFFTLTGAGSVSASGTLVSSSITAVGNGWYRCQISAAATASVTMVFRISAANAESAFFAGDGTSGIFIWGAQLNANPMEGGVTSSLTTYYPTTTAAYYAPRFDYNPSTLQPLGLLIEEARTNSIRNNTMVGAVAGTPGTLPTNWADSQVSGVTREVVAIGTESGISYIDLRISGTPSASSTGILTTFETVGGISASASQVWAQSLYVRLVAGALTNITGLSARITEFSSVPVQLRATSQALTPTSAGLSTQRTAFSATLGASTAFIRGDIVYTTTNGAAIDITLRIGLPQLEQGAFATSVIPTTTTALTRNADVASMTGTNFSSWYNNAEYTIFHKTLVQINNDGIVYGGVGNSFNDTAYFSRTAPNQFAFVRSGGSETAALSVSFTPTAGVAFQQALAVKADDFAFCVNGGTVSTDTSGAVPTSAVRLSIGNAPWTASGGGQRQQWVQRITFYPTRLPNSTLQALTA
jgi:hypothetical protein